MTQPVNRDYVSGPHRQRDLVDRLLARFLALSAAVNTTADPQARLHLTRLLHARDALFASDLRFALAWDAAVCRVRTDLRPPPPPRQPIPAPPPRVEYVEDATDEPVEDDGDDLRTDDAQSIDYGYPGGSPELDAWEQESVEEALLLLAFRQMGYAERLRAIDDARQVIQRGRN